MGFVAGGLREKDEQARDGDRGAGQARSTENLWRVLKGSALHNPDQKRAADPFKKYRQHHANPRRGYEGVGNGPRPI